MNTFSKKNDRWVVKMDTESAPGQPATITMRNGATRDVKLGAFINSDEYGFYYEVAPRDDELRDPRTPAAQAEIVGDLSRIVGMISHAAQYLKFPAIVLEGFRVSIAGERAREPGSLTVTSATKDGNRRTWFGRVTRAGVWQPGRDAPDGLGPKLRALAADPVAVASAHGRLTGACCFCRKRLGEGEDQRSVEVGYGPICANHFGLPWGARGVHPDYQYDEPEQHSAMERENARMERD